jgi:hypothetical protein
MQISIHIKTRKRRIIGVFSDQDHFVNLDFQSACHVYHSKCRRMPTHMEKKCIFVSKNMLKDIHISAEKMSLWKSR